MSEYHLSSARSLYDTAYYALNEVKYMSEALSDAYYSGEDVRRTFKAVETTLRLVIDCAVAITLAVDGQRYVTQGIQGPPGPPGPPGPVLDWQQQPFVQSLLGDVAELKETAKDLQEQVDDLAEDLT
jgi:hypothetical protein